MSRTQFTADMFDLQRRNKLCNIRGCEKLPTKRIGLFEENRISKERKAIATVYLCGGHNETRIPAFMTEINKRNDIGKLITKRVNDIGFVTY